MTLFTNVRLPGYPGLYRLWIDSQGWVRAIKTTDQPFNQPPPADLEVLDFEGDWLSLGGVDLQINGALGLAFPDLTPESPETLAAICDYLWSSGVDAFLPTLVTASLEQIHTALASIQAFQRQAQGRCTSRILGVHLEGPCLNPSKRGAHPEQHLQPLSRAALEAVLGDYSDCVKLITLAPELDTTGEVIPWLRSLGITVSLGHSLATEAQARAAFGQGASMVTHAFNAMPALHHREPGLLGAALTTPGVRAGVIADGQHVCLTMLNLLLRAGQMDQHLFLVSDALAPLGLADGLYPWDERQIEVKNGTCRLADGTLAGTTLPLLAGVQNLVQWGLCSIDGAIALATTAPRLAIDPEADPSPLDQPLDSLLRWHWDETRQQLSWQRLVENPLESLPVPAISDFLP
jgi:N-acetylglucosamine-6-phosphate deacetylase